MSTITSQTFGQPRRFAAPLGARWAAEAVLAGARLFSQSRLSSLRLQRSRDAESVRRMARSVERSDPGFASDLYAAAARHDGLNDCI